MSALGVPQAPTFPPVGRGALAYLDRPVIGPAGSTPFPSPGAGPGMTMLSPSPYWGCPMQLQGKPKGLEGLWILKGQVMPPRRPRLRLVLL